MQDVIVFGSEGAKKFSATLNFLNNLAKFGLGKVVETKEGLVFMTRKESKELAKEEAKENDDVFKIEVVVKYEELLKNKEEAAKLEDFENTAKYIVASELVSEYEKTFNSILKDHERQVLEIKQKNEPDNFTEEDLSKLKNLSEAKEKINVKAFSKKLSDFNEKNKDIEALETKAKDAMEEKARITLEKMAQEALEASKKTEAETKRVEEELIQRANQEQINLKQKQIKELKKEVKFLKEGTRKFLVPETISNKLKKVSSSIRDKFNKFVESLKVQHPTVVTEEPVVEETIEPTVEPVVEETIEPTVEPVVEETTEPTEEPVVEEAVEPTVEPVVEETIEPTVEPVVEEDIKVNVTTFETSIPEEDKFADITKVYEDISKGHKDFANEDLVKELMLETKADKQWVERALHAKNNDIDLARVWLDDRGKVSYDKPIEKDLSDEKDLKIESLENKIKELELANLNKDEQHKELLAKMDEMTESIKHLEKVVIATASMNNSVEKDDFEIPFQK
jgi:hypothetical protein